MKKYTILTSPTPDGEVSEIFYNEENPIADNLQPNCNDVADDLQPSCNGIADNMQPSCNDVADQLQPKQNFKRPRPLTENDDYGEIEKFLNDKEYISKISNGLYGDINEILNSQLGLPKYIIADLQGRGLAIDDAKARREILPLLRVRQKETIIRKQRKFNVICVIMLIITLTYIVLSKKPSSPTLSTEPIITDSVCTAAELHKYIVEYTKLTKKVIYPYSENIILQRVNQKKLTSITDIKYEIETRLKEISTR